MTTDTRIAVVGMSLRYPSARNKKEFHRMLAEGIAAPADNHQVRGDLLGIPDYKSLIHNIRLIDGIDEFDNTFFGIVTPEAKEMPPEMRLSLQCSAEALMDAGYSIRELGEKNCGAVVSHTSGTYRNLLERSTLLSFFNNMAGMTGGYLSHYLKLTGPVYNLDSTCSSSIAAVAAACNHLIMGQADMMIAGGVQICLALNEQDSKDMQISALSIGSDQRCIPFDVNAAGFYNGEGVGFVVLKRYDDAVRNGDNILGIICGCGMYSNSDKAQTVYAPNAEAQYKALESAWKMAGVTCNDITEFEAHGSATKQGDAAEAQNLRLAFSNRENPQKVYLTAVKSNLGHTACAAGITSLLKVLSGFAHNIVYPIAGFTEAASNLELDAANVVPVATGVIVPEGKKRIADISSYGLNELNVNVVVKNHTDKDRSVSCAAPQDKFLKCSAKSEAQLRLYLEHIAEDLTECDDDIFWDMIYTLNSGRDDFNFRCFIIFESKEELAEALKNETEIVKCKPSDKISNADNRNKLRRDYLDGRYIDWKAWYSGRRYKRVPAAIYPFSKKSIWPAVKQK